MSGYDPPMPGLDGTAAASGNPGPAGPAIPRYVHRMGMAGLSRNVGFGANKVFAAALLQTFSASQPVIGFVLALEGLFGIILNPLTGWTSDRTRRRILRRKVYVLVALPLAGIFWILFCFSHSFALAAVALGLFYVFEQSSLSPYQAWIPDITPTSRWGVASGWLNLWWEVGNLVSFLAIPLVWKVDHIGAYVLTGVLVAGGGLVTGLTVPEQLPTRADESAVAPAAPAAPAEMADVAADHCAELTDSRAHRRADGWTDGREARPNYRKLAQRSFVFFFLSQALAWVAFESIASFFTLFMLHSVGGSQLDAGLAMSVFTVTGMGGALWSGGRYGRGVWTPKRLLSGSLALFGAIAILGLFYHNIVLVFVMVGVDGVFWGINLTVAYALASSLLHESSSHEEEERVIRGGLYGMSNFVQSVGLLVAAPIAGIVIRLSNGNYGGMFVVSCAAGLLGSVMVLGIRGPRANRPGR